MITSMSWNVRVIDTRRASVDRQNYSPRERGPAPGSEATPPRREVRRHPGREATPPREITPLVQNEAQNCPRKRWRRRADGRRPWRLLKKRQFARHLVHRVVLPEEPERRHGAWRHLVDDIATRDRRFRPNSSQTQLIRLRTHHHRQGGRTGRPVP